MDPYKYDVPTPSDLPNRLKGRYPVGRITEHGEPEFGYREFQTNDEIPAIQKEAADYIVYMEQLAINAVKLVNHLERERKELAERVYELEMKEIEGHRDLNAYDDRS